MNFPNKLSIKFWFRPMKFVNAFLDPYFHAGKDYH